MHILKSQHFDDEELIKFAASQSSVKGELKDQLLHWEFGALMTMKFDSRAQNYLFSEEKVPFHWDGAFFKEPRLLLFYCTETEGRGGETIFTNTEMIWKSLTEEEKKICRGARLTYTTERRAHYGGEITIPLVQTNPVTGERILRIAERVETKLNPVKLQIDGVEKPEEFYHFLVHKLYDPKFLYEHQWERGDLLICNNYTYLHGRRELGANRKRTFKRIQIL